MENGNIAPRQHEGVVRRVHIVDFKDEVLPNTETPSIPRATCTSPTVLQMGFTPLKCNFATGCSSALFKPKLSITF